MKRTLAPLQLANVKVLVKPAEAARLLSIGQTRLYGLIRSGELPVVRLPSVRISVAELEKWVQRVQRKSGENV